MRNEITELVFILDKSGSMSGLEDDTVGGFNAMIEREKERAGTVLVTTILFSNSYTFIHDRVDISDIKPLTTDDYVVYGNTALMDTLGTAIEHISKIHKYARPEDVPFHTIFAITTDGMENASRRYSQADIRKLIKEKRENNGWEFIFMAANIDAVETAERYGIDKDYAYNFDATSEGVYDTLCQLSLTFDDILFDNIDLD